MARLASYRGFLFGSHAADGDDLETFLGPEVRAAFDNLVDRAPDGEVELAGGKTVQRYRGNWKLQLENSIDLLHPRILHRSAIDAADRVDHGGQAAVDRVGHRQVERPHAARMGRHEDRRAAARPLLDGRLPHHRRSTRMRRLRKTAQARYRETHGRDAHGEKRAGEILAFNRHNTIVYPNLFVNSRVAQIRVLQPVSVDCTEQHGYVFRLKGAPEEMFEASVRMVNTNNSPSSIVTSDDHEIFERIQQSLAGGRHEWVRPVARAR